MRTMHLARSAAAAVLLAALAGCGASTLNSPPVTTLNSSQAYEMARQLSLTMMLGSSVPMGMSTTQPWSRSVAAPLRAARPALLDTTITGDGIVWQVSAHAYDAAGNEQAIPDSVTTYRVNLASWLHGAWSDPLGNVTLGSRSLLDVRGLGTTWDSTSTNGSRSDSLEMSVATDTLNAHYRSLCTGTLVDVIRDKPFAMHPYPASGAIHWSVSLDKDVTSGSGSEHVHWQATATVRFDGTHVARLVVNGVHTFLVDLDTGEVTPVVS